MIMDPNVCVRLGKVHCKSAGRLLASMLDLQTQNVPYMQIYNFYNRSSCLEPFDNYGSVVQSYEEWTERVSENDGLLWNLTLSIIEDSDCRQATCQALDFTGNADFAGIGVSSNLKHDLPDNSSPQSQVLVSFCIQISIATLFALFYLYLFFRGDRSTWRSFRDTFHTFFTSSVFFNVAIGLAATSTIIMENKTQYTAIFATLGFLLSLASTQTLWAMYKYQIDHPLKPQIATGTETVPAKTKSPTDSETRPLRLCLALLWITLLVICAFIIEVKWDSNFEIFCFDRLSGRPLATGLLYTPIGLVAIGLVCAVLKMLLPRVEKSKAWKWFVPATVCLGLVIMWLAFGTLWVLRTQLGTVAGKKYSDNHWGFGQVAAVAALLPTLVDIVRDSFKMLKGEDQAKSQDQEDVQEEAAGEAHQEQRGVQGQDQGRSEGAAGGWGSPV